MITMAFGGGNGKDLIVDASELTGRSEPIYCSDFSLWKVGFDRRRGRTRGDHDVNNPMFYATSFAMVFLLRVRSLVVIICPCIM
jgi:hypothetical protein